MSLETKQKTMAIIVALALTFVITNTFIHCKREFISGYNFKISRISVAPTKALIFYDGEGRKVSLWNYSIKSNVNVAVGDSVFKAPCSEVLYIYKRDDDKGEYREHLKRTPSGPFPFKWFCR
jgi:hypothetical protein